MLLDVNSKRKGSAGERLAAVEWRAAGFSEARRRLTREEARTEDADGIDLIGTDRYRCQVKFSRRPDPLAALAQIEAPEGTVPLAMVRKVGAYERLGWTITMRWKDFVECVLRTRPT